MSRRTPTPGAEGEGGGGHFGALFVRLATHATLVTGGPRARYPPFLTASHP